jgi:hypothetical protein
MFSLFFKQIEAKVFPYTALAIFALLLPLSWFFPAWIPLAAGIFFPYVTPGWYITDLGIAAVYLAFLFRWTSARPANRVFHAIFWPLLAIAGLALLTAPFARLPALAWYSAARWLLAVIVFLLLFFVNIPTRRIVAFLAASIVFQAALAWAQALLQRPLGLPGELTLPLTNPLSAALHVGGKAWLRAYGLTFHPNVLGGYLVVGLLLLLPWIKRRAVQAAWLLVLGGLFWSFSRSAWLAGAVTLLFYAAWYFRQNPIRVRRLVPGLAAALLGGAALLALFFPQVAARLNPFTSFSEFSSISARGQLIKIALDSLRADPLTGLGAGNFPIAMRSYQTLDAPHYVHNVILLLASEVGVLGGLLWLWLWIVPLVVLEPHLHKANPWPVVLSLAWFAWGLAGLWDSYPWALDTGRLCTVTLLALTARAYQAEETDEI